MKNTMKTLPGFGQEMVLQLYSANNTPHASLRVKRRQILKTCFLLKEFCKGPIVVGCVKLHEKNHTSKFQLDPMYGLENM